MLITNSTTDAAISLFRNALDPACAKSELSNAARNASTTIARSIAGVNSPGRSSSNAFRRGSSSTRFAATRAFNPGTLPRNPFSAATVAISASCNDRHARSMCQPDHHDATAFHRDSLRANMSSTTAASRTAVSRHTVPSGSSGSGAPNAARSALTRSSRDCTTSRQSVTFGVRSTMPLIVAPPTDNQTIAQPGIAGRQAETPPDQPNQRAQGPVWREGGGGCGWTGKQGGDRRRDG